MLRSLEGTRVVALPEALDGLMNDLSEVVGIRFAEDEAFWLAELGEARVLARDPHAIVVKESSFRGMWVPTEEARLLLEEHCEWEPPFDARQAQGAVAGVPAKLWFGEDRVLFMVQAPYAADFEERVS